MAESVGDVSVRAPGLRTRRHRLHPEKPWIGAEGRGFDSRQLHLVMSQDIVNGRTHITWVRPFVMHRISATRPARFEKWSRTAGRSLADESNATTCRGGSRVSRVLERPPAM